MPRWPGGVIRKTPVAPSGGTASGVWSMADVAYYKKLNLWPTLPGAPTIGTATAGSGQASVTFTAPTNTGTPSTITQYRVTSSPGGITATGASSPVTITGLTDGVSYTFTVAANNGAGYGPESAASNAVTPQTVLPSKTLITWTNDANSYRTDASIGTVSGTSLSLSSLGAILTSTAQNSAGLSLCYDAANRVFIYVYRDSTDAGKGKVVVLTPNASFTSVSVGTPVTFDASSVVMQMVTYIGSGKFCIVYQDEGNNDYATSIIGTTSGSTVSLGSPVVIHTSPAGIRNDAFGLTSNGAGTVVFGYMDGSTGYGYVKAATVSGTVPTWGSATTFETSGTVRWIALAYSTSAGNYALVYNTNTSSDGFGRVLTVSGTSVSVGSRTTFETGAAVCMSIAYDPTANAFAVLYGDANSAGVYTVKATMGSTLTYSSRVLFQSGDISQSAGQLGVASSSGLGKVVGVGLIGIPTNTLYSAVIDISGSTPVVGSRQTIASPSFYPPSIAAS